MLRSALSRVPPTSVTAAGRVAPGVRYLNRLKNSKLKTMEIEKKTYLPPLLTSKHGNEILNDPMTNKGTGFSLAERERLGIRGLVPPRVLSIEEQTARVLKRYHDNENNLQKYVYLNSLQDRNETLFYRVLMENIEEMAPIIYTPTVGDACLAFGTHFRRTRGMYISAEDRGEMHAIMYNWPYDEVDVIVVTDGSRILGLGDLGVHGMGIPIGKLCLYVAAGGIHPRKVLPVTIDVGTDNKNLLESDSYLGLPQPRIKGEVYFEIMDEFMDSIKHRWPEALIQFEDFNNASAAPLLRKYRNTHLCFNDDIQGTGTVTLAGLLCALRAQRKPYYAITEQRIVVLGAGSAGLGVSNSICHAMVQEGMSEEEAKRNFYIVDEHGVLGVERRTLSPTQRSYARPDIPNGLSLLETIREAKPTILLGLSGVPNTFTEEVVREMRKYCAQPIIFPLSNPTSRAECSLEQAVEWTDGSLLFASGSPFEPCDWHGRTYFATQGNNMYIFPGIGLGATICKAKHITDTMLYKSARALASSVTDEDLRDGKLYPSVRSIRKVSETVAYEVCKEAIDAGLCQRENLSRRNLKDVIETEAYYPDYAPLVGRND